MPAPPDNRRRHRHMREALADIVEPECDASSDPSRPILYLARTDNQDLARTLIYQSISQTLSAEHSRFRVMRHRMEDGPPELSDGDAFVVAETTPDPEDMRGLKRRRLKAALGLLISAVTICLQVWIITALS